jgi:hypothetical protein
MQARIAVLVAFAATAFADSARSQEPKTPAKAQQSSARGVTGTFDLGVQAGDNELPGVLTIESKADGLHATIAVGAHPAPVVKTVTREGATVKITAGDETSRAIYNLTFSGDSLSGTYEFNGMKGRIRGLRRK